MDKIGKLAMAFGEDEDKGVRGAMLDENMQKEEMSATALGKIISEMAKDSSQFARVAGKDVKEFAELVKTDMNQALIEFFAGLRSKGGFTELAKLFDQMGLDGARATAVLTTMANKIGDVAKYQKMANEAYEEGKSVINEFDTMNATITANLEKAKKGFYEVAIALGKKLQPAAALTISSFGMLVNIINTLLDFLKDHIKAVVTTTAAIVAYTVAVNASTMATKAWAGITAATKAVLSAYCTTVNLLQIGYYLLTGQIQRANIAMAVFNATTKTNPISALAGAILAATAALAVWVAANRKGVAALTEEEQAEKRLTEAKKRTLEISEKAASSVQKEATKVRQLSKILHDSNKSYKTRKAALDELQRIVPDYHASLTEEGKLLNDNTKAIDKYVEKLITEATVKAFADDIAEMSKQLAELEAQRDRVRNSINAVNRQKGKYADTGRDKVTDMYGNERVSGEMQKQNRTLAVHEGRLSSINDKISQTRTNLKTTQEALDRTISKSEDAIKGLIPDSDGSTPSPTTEASKPKKAPDPMKELRKQAKKRKAFYETQQAIATDNYAKGELSYSDYLEDMKALQLLSIQERKEIFRDFTDSSEYQDLLTEEIEATRRHEDEKTKLTLREIERRRLLQEVELQKQYEDRNSAIYHDEDALNEALFQNGMEAMRLRMENLKRGSKEWLDLKTQMEVEEQRHSLDKQNEYQRRLNEMREHYGTISVQEEERIALKGLESLHKAGLLKEEEYQQMLLAIKARYARMGAEQEETDRERTTSDILAVAQSSVPADTRAIGNADLDSAGLAGNVLSIANTISQYRTMYAQIEQMQAQNLITEEQAAEAKKQLWNETMSKITGAASAAYSSINQIANAASAYSQACSDYETAKITADYDRQIEAAGNNSKKKEKLEKERDKKIQAAKTKANKKAMKIEQAQAFASTAMAAINAYASAVKIPVVGHALAPIAAAAATAAGMLQIATIKKQHATEEIGYYEGGYTGGRRYRKEAGVVHEGEFVANHNAVNNQALRPALDLIDRAQRNNTIGSLTAADVSRALGQQTITISPQPIVINPSPSTGELRDAADKLCSSVDKLEEKLSRKIEAYVVMDGEQGLDRQYQRYKKLQR